MANTKLGQKSIGDIVKIKVDGQPRDFIVVHQGRPSDWYPATWIDGTVLMQRYLCEKAKWRTGSHSYGLDYNFNQYPLAADIKNILLDGPTFAYPPDLGSGYKKVFSLSTTEIGTTIPAPLYDGNYLQYVEQSGARFGYFVGADNAKRLATTEDEHAGIWWTRTWASLQNESGGSLKKRYAGTVSASGLAAYQLVHDDGDTITYEAYYVRPVFALPKDTMVTDGGSVTLNTAPTVPPSITMPSTIFGGKSSAITWGAATDGDNNLSGYKAERCLNGGAWTQIYQGALTNTSDTVPFGTNTAAYRVKAYDTENAESAYQTSPTRTVVNNVAPSTPSNITVPANVVGGSGLTVSWGASTDSDGNLTGYRLQRSVAGAAFAQIYQGTNLFFADTITKGWTTVAYRVKAYDSNGEESDYVTSPTRTVDNVSPPVITSSTTGNIGNKNADFSWQYTITHPDSKATTVTEAMDGVAVRTYTATLGQANTYSVTGTYFQSLSNGTHTMQVTATADGKSVSHTVTFTKTVYTLNITLATPLAAEGPITKLVMTVARSVPADATFQVLATNNANDTSPVWENVTTNVKNGTNYLFTNTTLAKTPAFNFKITVNRGASNTGGYISSIGGAFE